MQYENLIMNFPQQTPYQTLTGFVMFILLIWVIIALVNYFAKQSKQGKSGLQLKEYKIEGNLLDFENAVLLKTAKDKGFDLKKLALQEEVEDDKRFRKKFRDRVYEEMIKGTFGLAKTKENTKK